jgi:hypothetical protein
MNGAEFSLQAMGILLTQNCKFTRRKGPGLIEICNFDDPPSGLSFQKMSGNCGCLGSSHPRDHYQFSMPEFTATGAWNAS